MVNTYFSLKTQNFAKEAVLTVGIKFAFGGAILPLKADLKDPPEVIPKFVKICKESLDFVITFC